MTEAEKEADAPNDFIFQTAHELSEAMSRVHDPATGHQVTAENYPLVHRAFEMISHDSGGSAGHESYYVPWIFDCQEVESILSSIARLLPGEGFSDLDEHGLEQVKTFDDFVLGETTSKERWLAEQAEEGARFQCVDKFLNAFFEDFCEW